jgi:hypothetical protein
MATKEGEKTGGRKKGVQNKVTRDLKEAFVLLAENNLDKLQGWIDDIAVDDPKGAILIFFNMAEFILGRQSRTDVKIDSKTEATINIIELGEGKKDETTT